MDEDNEKQLPEDSAFYSYHVIVMLYQFIQESI